MKPLRVHKGQVVPIDRNNIDTDQIIPKQFLKRIERTGYEDFLFFDWRLDASGKPNPDFILNTEPYKQGSILLARRNFGCGSSREHAAWALENYGFRVVIAPSFADIFFSNSSKNGILTVILSEDEVEELFKRAQASKKYELTIDLESCKVSDDQGWSAKFSIDPFKRKCLLEGLDDIALTLQHEVDVAKYEREKTPGWR